MHVNKYEVMQMDHNETICSYYDISNRPFLVEHVSKPKIKHDNYENRFNMMSSDNKVPLNGHLWEDAW